MNRKQEEAIIAHGTNLLAIFPNAKEKDPLKLCKALRKLESQAHAIAVRLCNGPEFPGGDDCVDRMTDTILDKANLLLGNIRRPDNAKLPVFINRDPRGYALKIEDTWMQAHHPKLESDWGGYGIIAPEFK